MSGRYEDYLEANPHMRPEEPPERKGTDVWEEAMKFARYHGYTDGEDGLQQLMFDRREFGIAKYGQPLMSEDGRNTFKDMLDEALDGYAYAMKYFMQRNTHTSRRLVKVALEWLHLVWVHR